MNIVFNKCIFAYLCFFFYNLTKYFHEFQNIFVNFCFTDIFNISIKSKYQYIYVITDILIIDYNNQIKYENNIINISLIIFTFIEYINIKW